MRFERTWTTIAQTLPANWEDARLVVTVEKDADAEHAASLLAAAHPLRRGNTIRLHVHRDTGVGTEAVGRILRRLDRERIAGTLELEGAQERAAAEAAVRSSLAETWDTELAKLPPDWSDVVADVTLASTDWVDRAALLLAPTQPIRTGPQGPALRFRVARANGYGVSPAMARQSLARLDAQGIPAKLRVLWSLSDVGRVSTQGPVWRVEHRTV